MESAIFSFLAVMPVGSPSGQYCPAMKPRSIWKGHLRLELLTVPVRMYTALNEAERISFNQLHRACHQRLRQKLVCPLHGEVPREAIVNIHMGETMGSRLAVNTSCRPRDPGYGWGKVSSAIAMPDSPATE